MITSKIKHIQEGLVFLRAYIPTHPLIKEVYIYGSVAEGKETEESDIDLAIVSDSSEELFLDWEWFAFLGLNCPSELDYSIHDNVHDFESLDNWNKRVKLYERQS